jgi:hypothetical protein
LKFFWKLLTFFENFLEIFNKFFPFSQSLLSPCFLPAYAKSPPLLDKGARIQAVPCRPCAQSCLLVRHDMDRVPSLFFPLALFPAFPFFLNPILIRREFPEKFLEFFLLTSITPWDLPYPDTPHPSNHTNKGTSARDSDGFLTYWETAQFW